MPLTDFNLSRCPVANPNNNFTSCLYYDDIGPNICGFCKRPEYYRCLASNLQIPLSHSSVQDFLSCHHLYYLKAIRGIQIKPPATSTPIKLGSLWDAVLQKQAGVTVDIPGLINSYQISDRDVAKIKALFRAYKQLGISPEPDGILQSKINLSIKFEQRWTPDYPDTIQVTGYYDRKYPNHFVENKLSGRPDNYSDPWFINSQVGTYFLADQSLEHCIMEVCRTPDLKSTGQYKDELDEEYGERVFQDIISRPSHYFIGWNNKDHTYGKKFYRAEFNLEELANRFVHIMREIHQARLFNGWYKNDKVCNNILPGITCDFAGICKYNNMSEERYGIRDKPIVFQLPLDIF